VIAERKIQEAIEEGVFDHLEGAGRPLPEDDCAYLDPALRMAHRLMKNAGITPAWIAEGRELDREVQALDGLPESERSGRRMELNRRIAVFNLKTPVSSSHRRFVSE